jgi:hypothetical protein
MQRATHLSARAGWEEAQASRPPLALRLLVPAHGDSALARMPGLRARVNGCQGGVAATGRGGRASAPPWWKKNSQEAPHSTEVEPSCCCEGEFAVSGPTTPSYLDLVII